MNTMVWLHSFTVDGEKRQVVHGHNAVADYRDLAPDATAQQIDVAAVAELIEAARLIEKMDFFCDAKTIKDYELSVVSGKTINQIRTALARCGGAA